MKRIAFASLIISAAVVLALPLRAQQQPAHPIVGFLTSGSLSSLSKEWAEGFRRGLGESGFVEGQNVIIEYRAADDRYDRLPGLAAELVRNHAGVIVAAGGPVSALAAKKVTDSVPIVFTTIADPVKSGLVASLNRPGGNATGMAGLTSELDVKRLELLLQIKPSALVIGVLVNPARPGVDTNSMELEAAAYAMGRRLIFQNAGPDHPIEAAFEKLAEQKVDALVVTADPFFNFRRPQVVALAARYAIPGIYQWREFVTDGGLMSYGPSIADAYHQAGVYAGRILRGAKPADLPVTQPTRFELVINQKTAKTLGLEVSPQLIARADSVTD
jgi:putative tryptophan/tyrosine transport system substrate-binding protein